MIDTKTKMTWHFETAKMTFSIGSLPGELFDNGICKAWVDTTTRGAYLPPNKEWLSASRGPAVPLMTKMLIEILVALVNEGRVFFKGVPFQHLAFDCRTSRLGFPFLGLDDQFTTPWRLTRARQTDAFEGEDRTIISTPLKHLTGRHTGERIAHAVAQMMMAYGMKSPS